MNPVISFSFKLFAALLVVFAIHLFVLQSNNYPLFEHKIIAAYVVNYFLAIIIYIGLYKLRIKHSHILGFVFMAGSLLKFAVFFAFFYPDYRADGTIQRVESTAFLIPYISCLFLETYFLVKLLNKEF